MVLVRSLAESSKRLRRTESYVKKDTTRFELVLIEKIIVGVRRRIDNGDIPDLASKIEVHGLIHPILLDADYNLVCGGRRLLAFRHLGRKTIPATIRPPMSETARRLLERVENHARKAFTDIEDARDLVELARESAEELRRESLFDRPEGLNAHGGQKVPHRPKKPDNKKAVAERITEKTGLPVSRQTLERTEKRIAVVDEHPELEGASQRKTLGVASEKAVRQMRAARAEMGEDGPCLEPPLDSGYTLSEETRTRIAKLVEAHGYKSERSVLESGVEVLFTLVTKNKPPASVKRPVQGPTSPKFQSGDLCSDQSKGAICKTTLHPKGRHPECPKFPS